LEELAIDIQADVVLKYQSSRISKEEVHGKYLTNIGKISETGVKISSLEEYTTVMIEGFSSAIKNLNENIVKTIEADVNAYLAVHDKATINPSPLSRLEVASPAGAIAEPSISGPLFRDPVTGMEFVLVKGGCYRMGDVFGDGKPWERPVHEVCVDDFYLGKYEVTEGQWKTVMGDNPSKGGKGNDYPGRNITWEDAHTFALKLKYKTGVNYRLPTEAEWEYAARDGGKDEKWPGTNKEPELREYAWYSALQEPDVKQVGLKKPNALGLYDLAGNVQEWTSDWYERDYYGQSPKNNPKGPKWGKIKVLRGGSVGKDAADLRTTDRDNNISMNTDSSIGFRLMIQLR
jgi:formylglycine-generating enzyme required for sulfatase activity